MFPILNQRLINQLTNYSRSLSGLATIRQSRFLLICFGTTLYFVVGVLNILQNVYRVFCGMCAAYFAVRVLRILQYNLAAIISARRENHEDPGSQRSSH